MQIFRSRICHSRMALAGVVTGAAGCVRGETRSPHRDRGHRPGSNLQFDVSPVAGATSYELWFLANGNATWVKYMDTTAVADPVFNVTVSAHLLDWFNARYRVTACNAEGCSSTLKFAVTEHMKETPGYFQDARCGGGTLCVGPVSGIECGRQNTRRCRRRNRRDPDAQRDRLRVPEGRCRLAAHGAAHTARWRKKSTALAVRPVAWERPRPLAISADGTTILLGMSKGVSPGARVIHGRAGRPRTCSESLERRGSWKQEFTSPDKNLNNLRRDGGHRCRGTDTRAVVTIR